MFPWRSERWSETEIDELGGDETDLLKLVQRARQWRLDLGERLSERTTDCDRANLIEHCRRIEAGGMSCVSV